MPARMGVLAPVLLCALATGCGGGGGDGRDPDRSSKKEPIAVWIADTEPERVQAAREIFAGFTRRSGIKVTLEALGDDGLAGRVARAAREGTLPDAIRSRWRAPTPTATLTSAIGHRTSVAAVTNTGAWVWRWKVGLHGTPRAGRYVVTTRVTDRRGRSLIGSRLVSVRLG